MPIIIKSRDNFPAFVILAAKFMNPTNEDINKAILAAMAKRPQPILGAQLGALIRAELPSGTTLDMKSRFGGLKRMVDQCASGQVFWAGKSGLDDLFSTNQQSRREPQQQSAWVVFHNPSTEGHVYFDPLAKQLRSNSEGSPPEGCNSVVRVSHSDQRQMIEDFIQQHVPEENKGLFAAVSEAEDGQYWSVLSSALVESKLLPAWQKYRFESLRVLAVKRLGEAGVPSELREQVVDQAIADSSQMRSAKTAKKSEIIPPPAKSKSLGYPQAQGIHALAAQVVAQMSESDLESMNVPLGAVWKALNMRH